ncbi:MAG: 3-phosphoshikimate 1-carboxyvinyltransferase [Thiohalomonadales bacterium]
MLEKNLSRLQFTVESGGRLTGALRVPGDKSISHRAIMLGALANGCTKITGFLQGEDSLATLEAFRRMGVNIRGPQDGNVEIEGVGLHGLKASAARLDLGNAGTAMRLMSGLLAGQAFSSTLTGDASLSTRPMRRVIDPLSSMGAHIETADDGTAPLHIHGGKSLSGIRYDMKVASAQVKSSLLLAGLYAKGETCVTEPAPTRDHTERMLTGFGYSVRRDGATVCVSGGGQLTATNIDVPGDISSAAFFMVAASIAKDSEVTLQHVGINPTRMGVITILNLMGANISITNRREIGGEPVADITIKHAALKGIAIPPQQVPLAIDEFPVIFIAAACAQGTTTLTGARELRVKESDRIQAMADGLDVLGIKTTVTHDGIIIEGGQMDGGKVDSQGDHRIAMAFAMAGLRAERPIIIDNCANVATSFPNFVSLARHSGLRINEVEV